MRVSDGALSATQAIAVTVTDIDDTPPPGGDDDGDDDKNTPPPPPPGGGDGETPPPDDGDEDEDDDEQAPPPPPGDDEETPPPPDDDGDEDDDEQTPPPPPGGDGETPPAAGGAPTPAADRHEFGSGTFLLEGTAADLFGDSVFDFGPDDAIRFTDAVTRLSDLIISGNQVRLASAGPASAPLTFDGDFSNGRFFLVPTADGAGADLFFQRFLADDALVEARAVSEAEVNGAPHPAALTGDGQRSFRITLSDKATADDDNALGVYEIDAEGNIVDARVLLRSVKADPEATVVVEGVEAGHKLGFFIVQGGVGAGAATFTDAAGGTADLADGAELRLRVSGRAVEGAVFHAYAAGLNADGLVHARSGADPSGTGVRIAFEDLLGGGDRDFQDVVFRVDIIDANGDFIL